MSQERTPARLAYWARLKGSPSYKRTPETLERQRIARTGKTTRWKGGHHSPETRAKISEANRKKSARRWGIGATEINRGIRSGSRYQEWRANIFKRDNFSCRKCGRRGGGEIHAHHIYPLSKIIEDMSKTFPDMPTYDAMHEYAPIYNLDNGITLCHSCHEEEHGRKF